MRGFGGRHASKRIKYYALAQAVQTLPRHRPHLPACYSSPLRKDAPVTSTHIRSKPCVPALRHGVEPGPFRGASERRLRTLVAVELC